MVTITKGFRFRIYPNKIQRDLLARSFGCNRFVWNHCLGNSIEAYELWKDNPSLPKPRVGLKDFNSILNSLKANHEWLYEVSSVSLQQTTRDLTQAFTNFFRELKKGKVSYPKFKKKSNRNSFRLVGTAFSIRDNEFRIAKLKDPIKIKWSRALPSSPSSCTISQEPDGSYYVSFVCESYPVLTNGDGHVGIDLGLTDFITTDKGVKIKSPKPLGKSLKKLKRLQRQLSKKTKGSKNRNKARLRVAKQYRKVTNQRTDFLHKLSRSLVNDNQVIGVEGLKVSDMIKSKMISRAISDAGWGMFISMLRYKASESYRCTIVSMHPFYPSTQLCSVCGTQATEKIELSVRKWRCGTCSTEHDRDINAAKNILQKALHEYTFSGSIWRSGGVEARLTD